MPETTTIDFERRFAEIARTAMEPDWQEFEHMAALPGVQQLSKFEERYRDVWEDIDPDTFAFKSTLQEASPQEAARYLTEAYDRLDVFADALLTGYCTQKRRSVPDDPLEVGAILAKVVGGGVDKIEKCLKQGNLFDSEHMQYLSSSLLLFAARLSALQYYEQTVNDIMEPAVPEAEIGELLDERLQQACKRIGENKRLVTEKGASDIDLLFAGCINAMRTFYFGGTDPAFKSNHFTYCGPYWDASDLDLPDGELRRKFEEYAAKMKEQLGCDYTYPGPQKLRRQWAQALGYREQEGEFVQGSEAWKKRYKAETRHEVLALAIHSTRTFVNDIAEGRLKYSEIMQAMMQLRKQPLVGREIEEIEIPDEELDWEVLPIGTLEGEEVSERPPSPDLQVEKPKYEDELDWERIAKLKTYIRDWKGGYIARAKHKTVGLSTDRMYYVAVLPQILPDGTVMEHAIADHPRRGNGLYIWRAERATLRDPGDKNVGLTWRKVFSHKRVIARLLGAKRLYHTKNLDINVLDYLTCPPEQLAAHRYAVGKGALRIARLVDQSFE